MKPLVLIILAALAAPCWGEMVHLTDGSTLEGDLRRTNEGWVVTTPDGKVTMVSAAQVKSIELKKGESSDTSDQRLASLRRAVANQSDIKQIVERYKSFITQNAGSPSATEAEKDLAVWRDRLDKRLVKAGDQWVTQEQLQELQSKALEVANQLRAVIAAGKLNEATAGLDRQLAIAPQNASLLYLRGVIFLRQLQLAPSRTAFQAAVAALPDHAATHNNLGVIFWKQRAQMQALAEYDKAMLADPQNRTVLDNVTEALHGLAVEHQKADLTKRVVEHYKDQETALEKTMAAQGQYRWGSDWLSEKEFNKIQAAQKAVQDKLDSMKKDMDQVEARLIRVNREIQDDKQVQQAIASQSVQMDPVSGRTYSLPLPQRYYDLDRDIRSLQAEAVMLQRQYVDLQKLQLQQSRNMPAPKYTGVQKPFDVESMPGAAPVASASVTPPPATAPVADSGVPPVLPPTTAPVAPPAPPPLPPPTSGGVDFGPPVTPGTP